MFVFLLPSTESDSFPVANVLLHIAAAAGAPADKFVDDEAATANGHVRDADEFELHGLADDDDDEDNADIDVDAEESRLLKEDPANGHR
jgi:hypothetical protein